MSDAEDIDEIREQKREQLKEEATTPSEPVYVDSDAHLEELLEDNQVALADFYADWCGPCEMLDPIVREIADETDAAVLKIDIDELQGLAREYQVQGVPTLYLFVDGEVEDRMVGVQDKGTLLETVEAHA